MAQMSPNEANKPRLGMYTKELSAHPFCHRICFISIRMLLDEHYAIPHYSRKLHPILECISMHLHCIVLICSFYCCYCYCCCCFWILFFIFCSCLHHSYSMRKLFFAAFHNIISFCPKQNWLLFCHNDNAFTTIFDWHVVHLLFVICIHTHTHSQRRTQHTHFAKLNEMTKP